MALSEEQREIAPASVPSAQKPIAWATTNEDGDYTMLFFDKQEARGYSGDDEPIGLAPVPSIAPQPEQENYKAQRDALLEALEKAAVAFWKLDNADIHAQEAESSIASVKGGVWIGIASNCAIESGCCHCGDSMDNHASPFVCGHSPVDMADTAVSHAIEKSDKALALPNDTTALRRLLAEAKAGVYEECAKVCENSDRYRGDYFAAKIRELEEKAKK